MWCWPESPTVSSSETEVGSFRSGSTISVASKVFGQFPQEVVSLSRTETGEDVVLANLPPAPLLVGFMKDESEYHMWQVECMYVSIFQISSNLATSIPND